MFRRLAYGHLWNMVIMLPSCLALKVYVRATFFFLDSGGWVSTYCLGANMESTFIICLNALWRCQLCQGELYVLLQLTPTVKKLSLLLMCLITQAKGH